MTLETGKWRGWPGFHRRNAAARPLQRCFPPGPGHVEPRPPLRVQPGTMLALLLCAAQGGTGTTDLVRSPTEAVAFAFDRLELTDRSPGGALVVLRGGEILHAAARGSLLRTPGTRVACPEWSNALVGWTARALHEAELIDTSEHVGATLEAFDAVPGPLTLDDLIEDTTHLRDVEALLVFRGRGELGRIDRKGAVAALSLQRGGGRRRAPLSTRLVLEEVLVERVGTSMEELVESWLLPRGEGAAPYGPLVIAGDRAGGSIDDRPCVHDLHVARLSALEMAELYLARRDDRAVMDHLVVREDAERAARVGQAPRATALLEHVPSGLTILWAGANDDHPGLDVCIDVLEALTQEDLPQADHSGITFLGQGFGGSFSSQWRRFVKEMVPGTYRLPELGLPLTLECTESGVARLRIGAGPATVLRGGRHHPNMVGGEGVVADVQADGTVTVLAEGIDPEHAVEARVRLFFRRGEDKRLRPTELRMTQTFSHELRGLVVQ